MKTKIPTKFADINIDEFIDRIYSNHRAIPDDKYFFDLSEVEFIGNQELLVLSGLLKSFVESNIEFEVEFFKQGLPTSKINERVKRQIIQFWEVWKIWKIIPEGDYLKYFGIDGKSVEVLQRELNYYPTMSEIYTRHGVTPFITLDYINNYSEIDIQQLINPIYKLNSAIQELLTVNKCYHPFTSNYLSTIITEELYLNFLDHSSEPSFKGFKNMAFMNISFQAKIDDAKYSFDEVQKIKSLNFNTECLPETKKFFFDNDTQSYKNKPYIQFSFLDFGKGIVETLREHYIDQHQKIKSKRIDSDILRFAFNHDSSRHPIFDSKNKAAKLIPRGLFDALTVVRRYKGLLIVRSNYGKILFDFSVSNDLERAFSYFGDGKCYFPGTLVSLCIPDIEDVSTINISAIKPEIIFSKIQPENRIYVNVNSFVDSLRVGKEILYNTLLSALKKEICSTTIPSLALISFKGDSLVEKRIIKKLLYFLLTDYDINHFNNVIILNSPPFNLMEEISSEIIGLNEAIKNYKIHPLPIVDFNEGTGQVTLQWLGVYSEEDKIKLNELLYEEYSIAKSDFRDPTNILGQLNEFDNYGNLLSNFPSSSEILDFYKREDNILTSIEVERLLGKYNCVKIDDGKSLYLCNGGYYQKEYVELNNLINDKSDCNVIALLLYDKIKKALITTDQYKFIGITTSSQKILKSFELQGYITSNDYIALDNYHTFENELSNETVDSAKKYILICDVISTGFLTRKLNNKLIQLGTKIEYIAVIASILHPDFESSKSFIDEFEKKIISLHEIPVKKYRRKDVNEEIISKDIIRINPHTNIPITLSINETNYNDSIIFHSQISYDIKNNEINISNKFLDSIGVESINVGFLKFNNVIHPYFFNTDLILKEISESLLREIFKKINKRDIEKEKLQIFFPRKSGIENFDFNQLKKVLNNHLIEEIEIERFGTPEGWRFPHNTDYLNAKIENNICFILDDGSCSGDSLIQMIDEISFYSAKEIFLLCFIGRVVDHKREFFSRLSNIRVKDGNSIPISIYFACHWHIPTYYLDENPNIKETSWLSEIINLQNTPQNIKRIAYSIIKEILPKDKDNFSDYKYLPKIKDTAVIPKKELLLIREELGKVIGYRLYKESFIFFDYFIKKYEALRNSKDRYKEIELLCATFVYEPYLYDKIAGILPDVISRIEDFVRVLIFSDQRIYELLTYKWDKKDIVHLFFIVFKNEKLIQELTIDRFKLLIAFTQQVNSTTNYVLYKLLKYFPLSSDQFNDKKFDNQIKNLIVELKGDETIPNKEIRKYYNFITSLPSRNDFLSQLSQLKENYSKQKEPEFHDEKKSFNHNISELIVTIRELVSDINENRQLDTIKINTIRKCWYKILNFVNPILSFSSSFNDFLLPYTFYELVSQTNSLRKMVGFIDDIVLSNNESLLDVEKLETIKKHVIKIQSDFEINSIFYQLIDSHESNLFEFVFSLKKEFSVFWNVVEQGTINETGKSNLEIPKLYMDKLLTAELVTNMKKYSTGHDMAIVFLTYKYLSDDLFELEIRNSIMNLTSKNSNGEGTKCIKLLSDSKLFGFTYESKTDGPIYIQTLTFNIR